MGSLKSMRIDVITIFPALFEPFANCGIVGRARGKGLLHLAVHDLRQYAADRHRTVDDTPYGGGPGMVMKPEPWFAALRAILGSEESVSDSCEVVLLTPRGKRLEQTLLEQLSNRRRIVLICGRYEGIDDRVRQRWATMELSVGDFVLSGGELPAQTIIEGVTRLLPGAIGDPESAADDSFSTGLLGHRQFTKPTRNEGLSVPEELLGGDQEKIRLWRLRDTLEATLRRRPDMLDKAGLTEEMHNLLREIKREKQLSGTAGSDITEN